MMQPDNIQDFFSISSRIVLIVPFVVIFIALGVRYQIFDSNEPVIQKQTAVSLPKNNSSITVSIHVKKAGFDLKGDVVCSFFDKEASISAYKKGSNIFFRNSMQKETNNYLVNGDCVYIWKKGGYTGQKVCNVEQYVSIAQTLFSSGLFDVNILMSYLPQTVSASQSALPVTKIKQVIQSCHNQEVTEKGLFEVPKNVVFTQMSRL